MIDIRPTTINTLERYQLEDEKGEVIDWTPNQQAIIDCILHRESMDGKKRIQILATTRWGKSLSVAAGTAIRASLKPEKWAIVAGTKEKARIIMEHITMFSLDCPAIRTQLAVDTPLDRLRMRKSQDRLNYKRRGEVRVFSADAWRVSEVSKSVMGFGAPNVIEDESALIQNTLHATVMRMLGDQTDNFLVKIGNPFNRNHFLRSWRNDKYHKIFVDYKTAIEEGRLSKEFVDEMREEALFSVFYECKFPEEDAIDEGGWLPLLTDTEIERAITTEGQMFGDIRLGCDVAGGGRNFSTMVARSFSLARKVYKKREQDTMLFSGSVVKKAKALKVKDQDIFIDNVGIGKGAFDRLREIKDRVVGVSGGKNPSERRRFANLRAEMYWRARSWILHGGKLEDDNDWYQLADMKYKVDSSGKLKMMSKMEMLREGIDSPDVADAFAMTFVRTDIPPAHQEQPMVVESSPEEVNLDPYD